MPQAAHSKVKGFPPCGHTWRRRMPDIETPRASGLRQASGAGVIVGKLALELDQLGGKLGHGMALKANRMFTLCSYPKRQPLSLPIVGRSLRDKPFEQYSSEL